jgi:hypothetical protein
MKTLRVLLIIILSLITVLSAYFILDRYVFNPQIKGISLADIKNILTYFILPLIVLLLIVLVIERKSKNLIRLINLKN